MGHVGNNVILKWILVFILTIHGIIHIMGFLKAWGLAEIKGLTDQTLIPLSSSAARIFGIVWLLATIIFLVSAAGLIIDRGYAIAKR